MKEKNFRNLQQDYRKTLWKTKEKHTHTHIKPYRTPKYLRAAKKFPMA